MMSPFYVRKNKNVVEKIHYTKGQIALALFSSLTFIYFFFMIFGHAAMGSLYPVMYDPGFIGII